MSVKLRPYQDRSIEETYAHFKNGKKRGLVWLQTGLGKSFLYCYFAKDFIKYGNVVIVMRRRELVKQGSRSLSKMGVDHSVYMSGDPRLNLKKKVQICSIDTIDARDSYPHVGGNTLILIDESHDCTPRSSKYKKLFEVYSNSFIIGFTATPFKDNSMFEFIVNPISAMDAMKQGYLVPVRTFVPNIIDVSKVRIKKSGDFDERELFEAVSKSAVIGDVVNDWRIHAKGKRTIVFAVNIQHSQMLCDAFNQAGIKSYHADAKTSSKERDRLLEKFARGDFKVLCNVNIFSTGIDVTEIECVQFARPTNSIVYFLQAVGRGLRPSPQISKTECILLDNAGNILRHGSPYKARKVSLQKQKGGKDPSDLTIRTCKKCFYVFPANEQQCPNCGFRNEPIKYDIKTMSGELIELFLSDEEITELKKSAFIKDFYKLKFIQKSRGLYKDFAQHKLKDKYGQEDFDQFKELVL